MDDLADQVARAIQRSVKYIDLVELQINHEDIQTFVYAIDAYCRASGYSWSSALADEGVSFWGWTEDAIDDLQDWRLRVYVKD